MGEMPNIRNDILVSPSVYVAATCILWVKRVPQSEAFIYQLEMVSKIAVYKYIYMYISDVCGLRSPLQLVATPCCWFLCGSRGPEVKPKNVNQELARLCPSLCIYRYILHTIWNTIHMYIYIYIWESS